MERTRIRLSGFILICLFVISCKPLEVDYLITGALVFDGSMNEPGIYDVGIREDRIVFTGRNIVRDVRAKRVIDASGLYLAPGFIDPHTHAAADLNNPDRRCLQAWLWQGVTTVFEGNDGSSPFPIGEQLVAWQNQGMGANVGLLAGHGSIRRKVMGMSDQEATDQELDAMLHLIRQAMSEGAFGMSTGLFYAPGSYASTEEIIALAREVAQWGGIYDTHLRDEGAYGIGLVASVQETIEIGERAGIPVHISHIKALGRNAWGLSREVVAQVNGARERGVDITANQYPYLASRTSLRAAVIPRWAEAGGRAALMERLADPDLAFTLDQEIAQNIYIRGGGQAIVFTTSKQDDLHGKSLREVADHMEISEVDAVKQIILKDPGMGIISFNMHEEDVLRFMQQPWVMTGSDGGRGHPRKFGSFPRKIRWYVNEKEVLSMTEMIHRSSGLTAKTFQVKDRGTIREGHYADLILFDPATLDDFATFDQPEVYARGMEYVFVNGQLAIDQSVFTGTLAGRALRLHN